MKLTRWILDPYPLRTLALRMMDKLSLGSYEQRVKLGAVPRPHYGYCVYHAAALARKLGYPRISVIEFGVAGGNGLLNLEYHAQRIAVLFGIDIEIYGFDTGHGLPASADYRDLPYHWQEGFYSMDIPGLTKRLHKARLVLGDVKSTAQTFFSEYAPAPIGAMMHDLDYYSSTINALKILDGGMDHFLPRTFCYFDDIIGGDVELYSDYTGERLAINEFNKTHEYIKIANPYHLLCGRVVEPWHHQIRICHFLQHERYGAFVGTNSQQLAGW
jgi:hypothetical protein